MKYVAYNTAKSDFIRTQSNPSSIPRRLCDSETCVTASLQDGRGTTTAQFSAWKTGKMEILDALLLGKPITEAENEPPISKS